MSKIFSQPSPNTWILIAVKRDWVPDRLLSMLRWVVRFQPFRWILTKPRSDEDIAFLQDMEKIGTPL